MYVQNLAAMGQAQTLKSEALTAATEQTSLSLSVLKILNRVSIRVIQ